MSQSSTLVTLSWGFSRTSVDEILLLMYMNWSTYFRGLLFHYEMRPPFIFLRNACRKPKMKQLKNDVCCYEQIPEAAHQHLYSNLHSPIFQEFKTNKICRELQEKSGGTTSKTLPNEKFPTFKASLIFLNVQELNLDALVYAENQNGSFF